MRILVTGGCGFIGQHLVRRLLGSGQTVVVLDDFSTGRPDNLPSHPRLSIIESCVTDPFAVECAVEGTELIFHLASIVGQVSVSRDPERSAALSRLSVTNLNNAAPETPLVLFSSSAVYGLGSDEPCREDDPITAEAARAYDGGVEGYAYGKYLAETLVAGRAPGSWLTVRPFNVIGPGQVGTYGMVVPRFVRSALYREPVTIYGSGLQTRSFGDVGAFVGHLLALVAAWRQGGTEQGVYNLGAAVETRIEALIDSVDRVLETRTERHYQPYDLAYPGKRDVQRRRPCLERIESVLGPLSWPPLEQTILDIAEETLRSDRCTSPQRQDAVALAI